MPSGNLANASSVGANTVNGPSPLRVSIRPAASSAAASVENWPAATAVSTMSFFSCFPWWPALARVANAKSCVATKRLKRLRLMSVIGYLLLIVIVEVAATGWGSSCRPIHGNNGPSAFGDRTVCVCNSLFQVAGRR